MYHEKGKQGGGHLQKIVGFTTDGIIISYIMSSFTASFSTVLWNIIILT